MFLDLLVLGLEFLDEHVDLDAQLVDDVLVLLVLDLKLLGEDDVHLIHIALFLEHPSRLLLLELGVQLSYHLRVLGLLHVKHLFVVFKLPLLVLLEDVNLHLEPLLHLDQLQVFWCLRLLKQL